MVESKKGVSLDDAFNVQSQHQKVLRAAEAARAAAVAMAASKEKARDAALKLIVKEIEENQAQILEANEIDMEYAKEMQKEGTLSPALIARLRLDKSKLKGITDGINQVAELPDPVGQITLARELDKGLQLYRVTCPIGLIAVIFESRPDALPQIASLCIKSANAVILKGGREARMTNRALFECIERACARARLPQNILTLLESREAVDALLDADHLIDLIIPRGSNQLVRHIQMNTRIPVLGHSDGLCHLYIDRYANLTIANRVVVDSKVQYPAACNAIETLLVHESIGRKFLALIVPDLLNRGVELRCDSAIKLMLPKALRSQVAQSHEADWSTEYCDMILSIKAMNSINDAIRHINRYGSHHTDGIITDDEKAFEQFFAQVNSAGVYWNASTRFADGFRYGFGAEVGISTNRMHPRGPVGLEGLVTYKYKVIGKGHVVADYVGKGAKRFTHKTLFEDGSTS
ncbi:MAG TPA: glutamate-5-semialdehyde dehydrogenase [Trichormus sp.]|jgi:glutamate-5-semialdehyde dehydrogenase